MKLIIAATIVLLASSTGWTKVEFDSNQLMMKNADQITELVRKKVKKAQDLQAKQEDNADGTFMAEPEAIEQLKDALRIVLARPDQDGTRANAFARLRRELIDLNALDKAVEDIAKEAMNSIKNTSTPTRRAATYIVMLENLMAEIKPEVKANAVFKKTIEQIRDADIKVPDKVKSQAVLRSMATPKSPSETAAKILPKDSK